MTDGWTIDALLSLGIVAAWLGCFAFLKAGSAIQTLLHQPIFLAGTTGTALVLAAVMHEGMTVRVGKLVLLEAVLLVTGLVLSNGLARGARRRASEAIVLRPMRPARGRAVVPVTPVAPVVPVRRR